MRLGALLDGDRHVLDLCAAATLLHLGNAALLQSMQVLIEGGDAALDCARRCLDRAPVHLLAPLPRPVQMRDFLCFELHLRQAFAALGRLAAAQAADPAAALAELEASGRFRVPEVWFRQPIYYKCNRFSVCGPE